MGERQVEEHPHILLHRLVMTKRQSPAAIMQCQRVGGIHMPGVTERIARILVEQDEERQRAFGLVDPAFPLAAGGGPVEVGEGFAECAVEGLVLAEPFVGPRLAPETGDGEGFVGNGHASLQLKFQLSGSAACCSSFKSTPVSLRFKASRMSQNAFAAARGSFRPASRMLEMQLRSASERPGRGP